MKNQLNVFKLAAITWLLFLSFIIMPFSSKAQSDDQMYYQLAYMKVKPGMYEDYLKLETDVWKLIHKERVKQGRSAGWFLYEILFPGGTDAEYDFVIVNSVKGWKGIETMWNGTEDMAKKVLSKEQMLLMDKTEQLRDIVKVELWAQNDFVSDARDSIARYQICNYMQVPGGRYEEYMSMEKNLAKPMHQESIKMGDRAGWGLYGLVFPYSDNAPYQMAAVDFYYSWDDVQGGDGGSLLEKVHPGLSEAYIERQINSARTLVRQEVRVLVDYVD